jgi:hypothetical protein
MGARAAVLVPAALVLVLLASRASAQEVTCGDYAGLEQVQRTYLAYGYLEGVQAALDKERTDVLVPPSDPRHPIWWVLPGGLGEKPFLGLAERLDAHCRASENRRDSLLRAFLSISVQRQGSPWMGASTYKKEAEAWKNFLGGKETSLSCSDYLTLPEGTRQAGVYGYYLGTEALRIRLGRSAGFEAVWPSRSSTQAVRLEADQRCQVDKTGTFRSAMSAATTELAGR